VPGPSGKVWSCSTCGTGPGDQPWDGTREPGGCQFVCKAGAAAVALERVSDHGKTLSLGPALPRAAGEPALPCRGTISRPATETRQQLAGQDRA
jgi:hypothetical protein